MQGLLLPSFYDTQIAPEFSKFSGAVLDDLSSIDPEQEHWLLNNAMNSLSQSYKDDYRVLVFNHLRRVHGALDAYHQLRRVLLEYPPIPPRRTTLLLGA